MLNRLLLSCYLRSFASQRSCHSSGKMTLPPEDCILNAADVNRLKTRAMESEQLLLALKAELEELTSLFKEKRNRDLNTRLIDENAQLRLQVDELKKKLVKIEVEHMVPQVARPPFPRPAGVEICTSSQPPVQAEVSESKKEKLAKPQKSAKKEQPKIASGESSNQTIKQEASIDVSRLDLRVGRIISAKKHPDADALYVEDVDVGEEQPRTVVSGLVRFVPLDEMQNRMAVLLCNLKPAKMRGVTSQAMVMCASTPDKVEILNPPAGAQPGDQIHVKGYPRNPDVVLNPKHKVFETVAPDLKTDANKVATYKGIPLEVLEKGKVMAASLAGVQIK